MGFDSFKSHFQFLDGTRSVLSCTNDSFNLHYSILISRHLLFPCTPYAQVDRNTVPNADASANVLPVGPHLAPRNNPSYHLSHDTAHP